MAQNLDLFDIVEPDIQISEAQRNRARRAREIKRFGGTLLKGNPKLARPVSRTQAMHLVLKSELARGAKSFLAPSRAKKLDYIIRTHAKARGIRIYSLVNVGNHFHIVMRLALPSIGAAKRAFRAFVRSISGIIARLVLGAQRGSGKGLKFWQARPFTRLISWGSDYNNVIAYMNKNRRQAKAVASFGDIGFSLTSLSHILWLEAG